MTKEDKRRFYKSTPWKHKRLEALERDNYECQECKRQGRYHKGEQVHHIKEIYHHPEMALELDNLETLCIRCHNAEHGRTTDKFVERKGEKWDHDEKW